MVRLLDFFFLLRNQYIIPIMLIAIGNYGSRTIQYALINLIYIVPYKFQVEHYNFYVKHVFFFTLIDQFSGDMVYFPTWIPIWDIFRHGFQHGIFSNMDSKHGIFSDMDSKHGIFSGMDSNMEYFPTWDNFQHRISFDNTPSTRQCFIQNISYVNLLPG